MNKRNVLLAVAAILAAGAGLLTFNYLSSANKHVATSPPRPVLVATADIPAHATLTSAMVSVEMRPTSDVDPDAYSSPEQIAGYVTLGPVPAGAMITASNTSRNEGWTGPLQLPHGMRAISIPVDEVRDVSGLVEPGDKVDVIAIPPRIGTAQPEASTILRDITVIAVGGALSTGVVATPPPGSTVSIPRSVTLEVTPKQADLLAMADLNATLRLALRPMGDRDKGPVEQLVFGTQTYSSAPAPVAAAAPAAAVAPPIQHIATPASSVIIIDGDQIGAPDTGNGSSSSNK